MAFIKQMGEIVASLRPGATHNIIGHTNVYDLLDWTDAEIKPTEQELLDHEIVMVKADRKALVKVEANTRIIALWPEWKQRNAALGGYVSDYTATQVVTDATNASPIVITQDGHGWQTGDKVTITGVGGNSAANVSDNDITKIDTNSYSLDGTTGDGAYTGGGDAKRQMELGIKNDIAKIRDNSNTAESDIDALSTAQAVVDFTW